MRLRGHDACLLRTYFISCKQVRTCADPNKKLLNCTRYQICVIYNKNHFRQIGSKFNCFVLSFLKFCFASPESNIIMSFIKENHKDKKILMIFSCLQIKIVIVKHKKWPLKSIAIKSVFLMDSPSPLNWIFYILKYNIPVIYTL